jgi:hypothetical protein
MVKGAIISKCKKYRYRLWRIWDNSKPYVLFIMLNPSTADSNIDDPTIRRCIGFANSWGYGGLYVGNLFAYRSTQPNVLFETKDPIGEENKHHLSEMSEKCEIAICAWGNPNIIKKLNHNSLDFLNTPLHYLALTINGTPRHPLYLKSNLIPIVFKNNNH